MNKASLLSKFATAALLAFGAVAAFSNSSPAQSSVNRYYCGTSDGVPTTMYTDGIASSALIRWVFTGFRDWPPQLRCEEVAQRFQQYQDEGTLEFITTGHMGGYDVVCVASEYGGPCGDRVLFTLPPGRDPNQALQKIFNIAGVYENNDPRSLTPDTRLYIDVDKLIYHRRNSR
jgi:Circadian oscillating protein COP23